MRQTGSDEIDSPRQHEEDPPRGAVTGSRYVVVIRTDTNLSGAVVAHAEGADEPMDQSREAHRSARPLHSP